MERSGDDAAGTRSADIIKSAGEPLSGTISSELFGTLDAIKVTAHPHGLQVPEDEKPRILSRDSK